MTQPTKEKVIAWAREAGFTDHNRFCEVIVRHSNGSWSGVKDELERFAALVAAAEREACAKVCAEQRSIEWVRASLPLIRHEPSNIMAEKCAAAIRARGNT